MKKYVCTICGFVYDEAVGIASAGIAPGTKWEDLPPDWVCPVCKAAKSDFKEQVAAPAQKQPVKIAPHNEELRELSVGELSALCSNLAKGAEKQYLKEESALFTTLADYFKAATPNESNASVQSLRAMVQNDIDKGLVAANEAAGAEPDRGALRVLVWGEKVTRMLNSIITRYEKEGDAFIAHTNVYVCDICGFIYVGDNPPEICPVCKVPSWKFTKIERR